MGGGGVSRVLPGLGCLRGLHNVGEWGRDEEGRTESIQRAAVPEVWESHTLPQQQVRGRPGVRQRASEESEDGVLG